MSKCWICGKENVGSSCVHTGLELKFSGRITSLERENADLRTKLTYVEDAAAKGDKARQQCGGMEMEIEELSRDKERLDSYPNIRNKIVYIPLAQVWQVGHLTFRNFRQAIDAAMTKEEGK